jgi:hypothetical protein
MFPFAAFSNFNILIINQTNSTQLISDFETIKVINVDEKGLSKSRNLAIKNASKNICLIADDDVVYFANFDTEVIKAFNQNPQASIISFNHQRIGVEKPNNLSKTVYAHSKKTIENVCSIEIAFQLKDVAANNLIFDENFGLGSYFETAEEYLFLKETAFRLFKKEVESNYEKWYNEYTVNLASSKHFEQININNVEGFKREFKRIYETISALYIQLVNSSIINPIILYVPKNILDIFDKLKQVHEKTKTAVGRLSSQGYSNQEINRILFNAYESLSGEIEARNVQQISKLDAEMQDYFVPLSSESIQDEKVGVIYDEMVSDEIFPTKIVGAIEKTKEDLYIIHLNWANTPKPILHEIGHLLHDLLNTDTLTDYVGNKIKNELPNLDYENNSNLIGEIFCDLFLGYLERLNLSEEFTYEISVEIKYKDIRIFDQDFDNVFLAKEDSKSDNEMMKMLQFLKKLNESIQ